MFYEITKKAPIVSAISIAFSLFALPAKAGEQREFSNWIFDEDLAMAVESLNENLRNDGKALDSRGIFFRTRELHVIARAFKIRQTEEAWKEVEPIVLDLMKEAIETLRSERDGKRYQAVSKYLKTL